MGGFSGISSGLSGSGGPSARTYISTSAAIATAGVGLLEAAPGSGPLAPIIAAAAVVAIIASEFFKGANPLQVPAAQAEQIYEIASDNAYALTKIGMVSVADAIAGMQAFLSIGISDIQSRNLGSAGAAGIANMTKVINAEIQAVSQLPGNVNQVIDINKAHSVYMGGSGWYAASVTAGAQLTDQWLNTLQGSVTGTVAGVVGSAVSSISSLLGISTPATAGQPSTGLTLSPTIIVLGIVVVIILIKIL